MDLDTKKKQSPAIIHALKVREAISSWNYHIFFKLYLTAPNMGGYLMDFFVDRIRMLALKVMTKA